MGCACGHQHITFAENASADEIAIEDLNKQAKTATPPLRPLLRARRDQLRAEVRAVKSLNRAISKSNEALMDAVRGALEMGMPQSLLNLSPDELRAFIMVNGMGAAVDSFGGAQLDIYESIIDVMQASAPEFDMSLVSPAVSAIQERTVDAVFNQLIIPDTQRAINDTLSMMTYGDSSDLIIGALSSRLKKSTGRQLTEARTKLTSFGRVIMHDAGAAAGLDHYLYSGPIDGITRAFCKALAGKVLTDQQISKLNNGSGLSVRSSGGGYNCRHNFSATSQGLIKSANLPLAKSRDISKANAGAK